MRRIISLVLSMVMIFTALSGFNITAKAASTSKYKSKIKQAINSTKKYVGSDHNGFLFDFDGNGTKELVMTYWTKSSYDAKNILKVYTIKKGKIVTVLTKTITPYYTGELNKAIGIAKKNRKKYLFLKTEMGPGIVSGTMKLYSIKGSKASCNTTAKYEQAYDYGTGKMVFSSKINGKSKTKNQFVKWQKTFSLSKINRVKNENQPSGFNYICKAPSLSKLYKKL